MKIFLAVFSLAFIIAHTKATEIEELSFDAPNFVVNKDAGTKFKEVMERFKEIFKNGNETLGIPAMDPYKSAPLKLSYKSDKFRGQLNIVSADVCGISNYVVNKAEFKMIGLKMSLGLHWDKLQGDINAYNFNGVLMNLTDIYGKGSAEFTLKDLNVSSAFSLNINTTTKKLSIKRMETELSLGSLKFYSEGIYDDRDISQVASAIISDLAPKFIQMFQRELTDILNEILTDIGNDFISTKSLHDLLALIS